MQNQGVDDFLASLLDENGITNLEPKIRQDLIDDMRQRLFNQINKEAILRLSEEKASELSTKLDDPNFTGDDMAQFLRDNGVNLTEVALDTMVKFRGFYLGVKE